MARKTVFRALRWLLVGCVAFAFVLLGFALFLDFRRTGQSNSCQENLKRLGIALHAYHDLHGSLPPAYLLGPDGKPAHSWRVLILPFLGRQDLYDAYRFDEAWNGPNNSKLADKLAGVYDCPGDRDAPLWRTNYVAVVGSQTVWPGPKALKFEQVTDGTSNTIMLLEVARSDLHWMEPRDVFMSEVLSSEEGRIGARFTSTHDGVTHALFCDGSVHRIKQDIHRRIMFALLTPASGIPFGGHWLPGEQLMAQPRFPAESEATQLAATDIQPHLGGSITPGRNYLYCATFQLAWDEVRQKFGAPLLVTGDPPLAAALNRRQFPRSALEPKSYLARMGFTSDGIRDAIRDEMSRKFPGIAPSLSESDAQAEILAYTFLQKNLPFKSTFDVLTEPLVFHGTGGDTRVQSFGIKELGTDGTYPDLFKGQVAVLDYVSDDDFVLSLRTEKDDIFLAKVRPGQTAEATLRAVQKRIQGKEFRDYLKDKETLVIPKFAFNILRRYGELTGKTLLNAPRRNPVFLEPRQVIRFILNESGAMLESEARLRFENGDEIPPRPRQLIFNKPFLMYLEQRQAQEPYLVLWVENTELMVPIKGKRMIRPRLLVSVYHSR